MELPQELLQAVETAIKSYGQRELSLAAKKLSDRYRRGLPSSFKSPIDCLAYLCTRFPATYAAMKRVFQERKSPIYSIVDFGAGLGTSIWAVPETTTLHLIEKDPLFKEFGQKLSSRANVTWEEADFTKLQTLPKGDLYLFSYSLGEVDPSLYPKLLRQFYSAAGEEIVIIEPGTPAGFERIYAMRTIFLEMGASLIAPCPHHTKCPMEGKNWCHFSQRLPRSPWHRLLKGGELGYEDEKFSYLIVSKKSFKQEKKRILRIPEKRPGHVIFQLCTENGVQEKIVSKKDKENYKKSKKLKWGDLIG